MAADQVAAAGGRERGGQFGSKKEPEPEEAVSDDEEPLPFECNPVWFVGAEAGPDDDDSAYTCLVCGEVDCVCVWSHRNNEASLAALDTAAQHFTVDTGWSLQEWVAFTGRGPQQQEAAANAHRQRKAGWKQAERKRGKQAAGAKAAGGSKTLDQFGFTKTAAAAAPVPVTVVDTSDEETDDGAAQLPLHYNRDYGELQRLLEDGVSCAKARGDWRDHLRYLATLKYHSLVAGDNPQERAKASQAVASVLYYRKGGMYDGTAMTYKYRAERIRSDLKYFAVHRSLLLDRRGMHVSNPSRIFDEGFQAKCRHVIKSIERGGSKEWSAREFHTALLVRPRPPARPPARPPCCRRTRARARARAPALHAPAHASAHASTLTATSRGTVCVCVHVSVCVCQAHLRGDGTLGATDGLSHVAACFHLRHMGMDLICPQKGVYKDGHERADIKQCRIDGYCKPIDALGRRIRPVETVPGCTAKRDCAGKCAGKGCVRLGSLGADLSEGDSEVVMVFHDEVSPPPFLFSLGLAAPGQLPCICVARPAAAAARRRSIHKACTRFFSSCARRRPSSAPTRVGAIAGARRATGFTATPRANR